MPPEADRADRFLDVISERFRIHERCFVEQDARPLGEAFIAPAAVWDFQGFPPLRGRAAVLGFFEQVVRTSTVAIKLLDWRVEGSMGWSLVDYAVAFTDGTAPVTLRTVFIWSCSAQEWLVEAGLGYKASPEEVAAERSAEKGGSRQGLQGRWSRFVGELATSARF